MLEGTTLRLSEWESFYVIVGSSAAALTGLMFVVIALQADAIHDEGGGAERAFGTPNVVHFCAVLLVAAILSTPGHTPATLALCLGGAGVAGLALSAWVVFQARRQSTYAMVTSDWIWHVVLPLLAYAAILAAAVAVLRRQAGSLHVLAAAGLLLLFIGIHNAWDAALWIATRRSPRGE